jgi:hypothetical protein
MKLQSRHHLLGLFGVTTLFDHLAIHHALEIFFAASIDMGSHYVSPAVSSVLGFQK